MPIISNGPSAWSVYQAQRDRAFINSIGTGAFGLGPMAYTLGASPENIRLSNQVDLAIGGLAIGAALRSAGQVTLPSGRVTFSAPMASGSAVPEGIVYLRTDVTGKLAPYVGQAISDARYLARQGEHARVFPNAEFKFTIIDRANPGRSLDIAEHNFIQELTGGVAARRSSAVSNLRDPVGAARRPAFGLPEPR